ncbi:hypothetical protein [Pusillimonas minor]|uniref:Uncharacterized protein n=1 Tax=Pusillimonas minor TaxID=2697024 RepID=A0A842HPF2_9BURK|nr:hypothetical protein [Pusillimonas minor]MBC2768785.1 hypothetical protein [Pusillimonas minor]
MAEAMSGKARNGCYLLAGWFTPPGELRGAQAGAVLGVGSCSGLGWPWVT